MKTPKTHTSRGKLFTRSFLRSVSFLTSTAFLLTSVSGNGELWAQSVSVRGSGETQLIQGANQGFEVPAEFGTLRDYNRPLDSNAPFIVHVQDAHANRDAQESIHNLLQWLKDYSAQNEQSELSVMVEGASGPLHPEFLRLFAEYPEVNEAVVQDLLSKGELSGAELFAWENYKKDPSLKGVSVQGVEETALYRENLQTYRDLLFRQDEIEAVFNSARRQLELAKSRVLSPALRDFFRERDRRKHGNYQNNDQASPQISAYVLYLTAQARKELQIDLEDRFEQVRFPNLTRLLVLEKLEKVLDRNRAEQEKKSALEMMMKKAVSEEDRRLLREFESLDAAMPARTIAESFWKQAAEKNVDLSAYGEMWKSVGSIVLRSEIEAEALFAEMDRLEGWLVERWMTNENERTLVGLLKDFELVEKLLALNWTPSDEKEFLSRRDEILNSVLGEGLQDLLKLTGEEKALQQFPVDFKRLSIEIEKALGFYDGARRRDEVILEKTLAKAGSGNLPVLISGGFHTDGLVSLMKERNVGYAVIQPHIRRTDNGVLYHNVLKERNSDVSSYFASPVLSKQEAIFFKAYLETAVPLLWEKQGVSHSEIGEKIASAMAAHPVLASTVNVETSAERGGSRLEITARKQAVKETDADAALIVSGDAVALTPNTEAPDLFNQAWVTVAGSYETVLPLPVSSARAVVDIIPAGTRFVISQSAAGASAERNELRADRTGTVAEPVKEALANALRAQPLSLDFKASELLNELGRIFRTEYAPLSLRVGKVNRDYPTETYRFKQSAPVFQGVGQSAVVVGEIVFEGTYDSGAGAVTSVYFQPPDSEPVELKTDKTGSVAETVEEALAGALRAQPLSLDFKANELLNELGRIFRTEYAPLSLRVERVTRSYPMETYRFKQSAPVYQGVGESAVVVGEIMFEGSYDSGAGAVTSVYFQVPDFKAVELTQSDKDLAELLRLTYNRERILAALDIARSLQRGVVKPSDLGGGYDVLARIGVTAETSDEALLGRAVSIVSHALEFKRGERAELREETWVEQNTPELKNYTVVSRQFEAGLNRNILEALEAKFGREVANFVAQSNFTGGLGALMPDLIDGWRKNGTDIVAIHPLYNNKIKGVVVGLPEDHTIDGRRLGDYLREILTDMGGDTGIEFTMKLPIGDDFRNRAQGKARGVVDQELTVRVYKAVTRFGETPSYYLDITYENAQGETVHLFDEVYPDTDAGSMLWRDVHMGAYAMASEKLTLILQQQGTVKENVLFVDNEVFASMPTPLIPQAIHHHINHTVFRPGLYRPDQSSFEMLGFPEWMRPYIVRDGKINVTDAVAFYSDVITGVGLYEHTPVLGQGGIFSGHLHKLTGYNEDGVRSTNGVLLDQWQTPEKRLLIQQYKAKLGLTQDVTDREFFKVLQGNGDLLDEFQRRSEYINAAYVGLFLQWLAVEQNQPLWRDLAVRAIADRSGETAGDPGVFFQDFLNAVRDALVDDKKWPELVRFETARDVLIEDPIVSNIRRQVPYKGPEKWIEVLESLRGRPEAIEDFRRNAARVVIGGRVFDQNAYRTFQRIKDLVEELGIQDRVVTVENYSIQTAPVIFQAMSGVVMLSDEFLEASATSMMKGLTNFARLIGVWGGAMPELFTIIEKSSGREVDVFGENVTHDQLVENLDNGTWEINNGYLVRYSETDISRQDGGGRRPQASSLADALRGLRADYKTPESRRAAQYYALASSPKVDIELSQTRAHAHLWASAIKARRHETSIYQDLGMTFADVQQLFQRPEGTGFNFNRKVDVARAETVTVEPGEAGTLGFLDSYRRLRMRGLEALWSLSYHASNTTSSEQGDVFHYILTGLLPPEDSSLAPVVREIKRLAAEAAATDDINLKVELNLEAFEVLDRLALYASWELLKQYAAGEPRAAELLRDRAVRETLVRYLDRFAHKLSSTAAGVRHYAVDLEGSRVIVAVNLSEFVFDYDKAWDTIYGAESFEALVGPEALRNVDGVFQAEDIVTGEVFRRHSVSDLLKRGLPVGVPGSANVQILRLTEPEEEKFIEYFGAAVREQFIGSNQIPATLLVQEVKKLRESPGRLREVLENVARELTPEEARKKFSDAQGNPTGVAPVMAFIAALSPDLLRYMREWDPAVYAQLDAIVNSTAYRDIFDRGDIQFHRPDQRQAIVFSRILDGRHVVIPVYFGTKPYNQQDGKTWIRIRQNLDVLGIENANRNYDVQDLLLNQKYTDAINGSDVYRSGWGVGIPVIGGPHFQILTITPKAAAAADRPVSRPELRSTEDDEAFARRILDLDVRAGSASSQDLQFLLDVREAMRGITIAEYKDMEPMMLVSLLSEGNLPQNYERLNEAQREHFEQFQRVVREYAVSGRNEIIYLSLGGTFGMSDPFVFIASINDLVGFNPETGDLLNPEFVSRLRQLYEAGRSELRDIDSVLFPELPREASTRAVIQTVSTIVESEPVNTVIPEESLEFSEAVTASVLATAEALSRQLEISRAEALVLILRQILPQETEDSAQWALVQATAREELGDALAARFIDSTGDNPFHYQQVVSASDLANEEDQLLIAFTLLSRKQHHMTFFLPPDEEDVVVTPEQLGMIRESVKKHIRSLGGSESAVERLSLIALQSESPRETQRAIIRSTQGVQGDLYHVVLHRTRAFLESFGVVRGVSRVDRGNVNYSKANFIAGALLDQKTENELNIFDLQNEMRRLGYSDAVIARITNMIQALQKIAIAA